MFDSRPKRAPPERDQRGEANPFAKLTRAKVLLIRKQAARAELRHRNEPRRRAWPRRWPPGFIRALAAAYGVSVKTIYEILSRKRWGHV